MPKRKKNASPSLTAVQCIGIALAVITATGGDRLAAAAQGQPPADRSAVKVTVDPRVELMSIIFRLAGNPEYSQGRIKNYADDVEEHFGTYRDHGVIQMARKLRQSRGVSYDAVMSMAVHIVDASSLAERVPFVPHPTELDQRWRTTEAREFLEAARDFVKESAFNQFFNSHRPLYEQTEKRLQKVLAEDAHLDWFDSFFGSRPQARFSVTIGMLNGGSSYGPRVRLKDGREQLYCILGAWSTDWSGDPKFDKSMLNTVIHEFCHSYANTIIDRHAEKLKPAGEKLFAHVEAAMRRQAYGNWRTMMYESLVRACTIRYAREHHGLWASTKQTLDDKARQFLWIGELAALLGSYEQQRDQYDNLDAFAPQIVAFFNQYAEKFEASQAKLSSKRPKVVTMMPTNGATDVDPGLALLKVVFDRPMQNGSWSLVGGGPDFPEITGKPSYDDDGKVWSVPIKLKSNWTYSCMLNSDRFTSFRSKEGVPLEPVRVTFKTGGK